MTVVVTKSLQRRSSPSDHPVSCESHEVEYLPRCLLIVARYMGFGVIFFSEFAATDWRQFGLEHGIHMIAGLTVNGWEIPVTYRSLHFFAHRDPV